MGSIIFVSSQYLYNKDIDVKLVRTTRFWNVLHGVR